MSHFHQPGRRRAGAAHVLGRYDPTADVVDLDRGAYWQSFIGGDDGRSARVRYTCPDGLPTADAVTDTIADVESLVLVSEPAQFVYELTFRSAAVCRTLLRRAQPSNLAPLGGEQGTRDSKWRPRMLLDVDEKRASMVVPGSRLLASLKGRCFQRAYDFWHYEFCPGKHLRQYHPDPAGNGPSIMLGHYDASNDEIYTPSPRQFPTSTNEMAYVLFAQGFVNGTARRSAVVHVTCAREKNEHLLVSVTEPRTLRYTALFSTPLACDMNCVGTRPRPRTPKPLPLPAVSKSAMPAA